MNCNCLIQNWPYLLVVVLPFGDRTFWDFSHESLIHHLLLGTDWNVRDFQRTISVILATFLLSCVYGVAEGRRVVRNWWLLWPIAKCVVRSSETFLYVVEVCDLLVFLLFLNIKPSSSCWDDGTVHNRQVIKVQLEFNRMLFLFR